MKKGIRKILTVCTSLTLTLSALTGTLGGSASASSDNYTVVSQTDLPKGTNLLVGKTGQCFAYAVQNQEELNVPAAEAFTDGTADGGGFIDVGYRNRSTYLIYDLGDKYDITNILLLGRTETPNCYPQEYNVRVADTKEGLFENSAVKASFINSDKEKGQYFAFKNVFPRGRYVCLLYTSPSPRDS